MKGLREPTRAGSGADRRVHRLCGHPEFRDHPLSFDVINPNGEAPSGEFLYLHHQVSGPVAGLRSVQEVESGAVGGRLSVSRCHAPIIVETLTYSQLMNFTETLLTIEDLAEYLGVPKRTIYAWRYRGTGPVGIRLGGHVRYRRHEVERWLDDQTDARDSLEPRRIGQRG